MKIDAPFGHVEIDDKSVGASVLVIYPGREITPHYHKKMTEFEVVLEGELEFNGKILKKWETNIYFLKKVHGYKNNSDKNARVLCISMPAYDESDVYEVKK